jgi:hypothetical protein
MFTSLQPSLYLSLRMVNFTPYQPSANQQIRIGSPHYGTPAEWVLSGPAGADGADTHSRRTRYFSLKGIRLRRSALLLELVVVNGEREVVSRVGYGKRTDGRVEMCLPEWIPLV